MSGKTEKEAAGGRSWPWESWRWPAIPEDWVARLWAAGLWLLVGAAAIGGLAAWVRPTSAAGPSEQPEVDVAGPVAEGWAAAGFAQRYVATYLAAGRDDADQITPFLGYDPNRLPEAPEEPAAPVRVVTVEPTGSGAWAVTTAVAAEPSVGERFWRVGVLDNGGGELVAAGLPTPVAGPPVPDQARSAVRMSSVPAGDDPLVSTVEGFISAYACSGGAGEALDRWLAPGAALVPLSPAMCDEAVLDRWGVVETGEDSRAVTVEAVLGSQAGERRVSFSLAVQLRDGRWEVSEVLPIPPGVGPSSGGDDQ